MDFNPTNPDIIGCELLPRSDDSAITQYRVDAPSKAAAMRFDVTVNEAMTGVAPVVIGDTPTGKSLIELLLAGQEVPTASTAIFRPTTLNSRMAEDTTGGGSAIPGAGVAFQGWRNHAGGTAGFADVAGASLDTSVYAAGNASKVDSIPGGTSGQSGSYINPQFTFGSTLTGKRIISADLHIVAGTHADLEATDVAALLHLSGVASPTIPQTDLWVPAAQSLQVNSFPRNGATEYVFSMGEIIPWSGTPANIGQPIITSDFVSVMAAGLIMQLKGTFASSTEGDHSAPFLGSVWIQFFQIWLEVTYCDENRVSAYVATTGAAAPNWPFGPVRTPSGGGTYNKVAGTDLTLLVRQPRYGTARPSTAAADYTFGVPYLEDLRGQTPVGVQQYAKIVLNTDGTVASLGDPAAGRVIPMEFDLSGVQSVDSQPFGLAYAYTFNAPNALDRNVNQLISNAIAITYEGVIFAVRVTDDATGDLTFTLKQGVTTLKTVSLTPDQARAFPADSVSGWRLVVMPFTSSIVLAPATQYKLQITTPNAGEWTIPYLDTVLPNASGNTSGLATYHGATDFPSWSSSGGGLFLGYTSREIPVLLYSQPDVITGLTATSEQRPFATPDDCGNEPMCAPTDIGYIRTTWDVSAEPLFDHYEVQREDEITDWQTVANITDVNGLVFDDYEARVGVTSCYRVRVASTAGLDSEWSAQACAVRNAFGAGLTFTANSYPEASVVYADVYDRPTTKEYDFPEVDEVKDQFIYARDGAISFIPSERRYAEFTRRLLVLALAQPSPALPGTTPADALRDLSRAALPYVCVCDAEGGRWFANVKVSKFTDVREVDGSQQGFVDVTIGTRTRDAYPIDVTAVS